MAAGCRRSIDQLPRVAEPRFAPGAYEPVVDGVPPLAGPPQAAAAGQRRQVPVRDAPGLEVRADPPVAELTGERPADGPAGVRSELYARRQHWLPPTPVVRTARRGFGPTRVRFVECATVEVGEE